jgi:L-alanine-DL-glutamate epimerase-like enolase superfamily enzyme
MTLLSVVEEQWPIRGTFTISRGSKTHAHVVVVTLEADGVQGRGECVPYARYGETVESVLALVESQRGAIASGLDRAGLQQALPPGAARNALDCAFWDLEAKRSARAAAVLAGVGEVPPPVTAYTLSLEGPEAMRARAAANAHRPLLKLKLGGEGDLERVRAVREGAPRARLIVDANEGWSASDYVRLAPALAELGVAMIEQPLPADDDAGLAGMRRPVAVCADESCHDRGSLAGLAERYDLVNIKLDKTGGLTEALALRREAEAMGLGIMVGCMLATSLAMAPALLLTPGAAYVDLDGPLLLAEDREPGLDFREDGRIQPPSAALWG